jgi:hypothetical protein
LGLKPADVWPEVVFPQTGPLLHGHPVSMNIPRLPPPQGDALERSMNCEVEAILRVYALARGETFARIVERGCTAPTR